MESASGHEPLRRRRLTSGSRAVCVVCSVRAEFYSSRVNTSFERFPLISSPRYISIVCCTYDRGQVCGSARVMHPPSPPLRTTTLRYVCAFADGLPHGTAVLLPPKSPPYPLHIFCRLCLPVMASSSCAAMFSTRAQGRGTTPSSPPSTTMVLQCVHLCPPASS